MKNCKLIILFIIGILLPTVAFSYDIMIICPEDFAEALEPLIAHKLKVGFSAQIVSLRYIALNYPRMADGSSIRDTPERVKYAIYDHHVNQGVQYVMLVGDGNVFPIRYIRGYLDDYTPNDTYATAEMIWEPSDLYYADVVDSLGNWESWELDSPTNERFGEIYRDGVNYDEIDYRPDVMLARVPASSVEEVKNFVTKIIRYEYLTTGEAWFHDMIYSAHDLGGWDPIGNFETTISEMGIKGFTPIRLYHDEFYNLVATPTATPTPTPYPPYPAQSADPIPVNFNFYMNIGVGFVFHSGHGNPTAWIGGCYADTDMAGLANWDRLPIIFAVSCETGRYCPYIPYDNYWKKSGGEQTEVDRYSIGTWICPEPSAYQRDSYNRRCMAEAWLVEDLDGAIGYFGCVNTGEKQSLYLGRKFFTAFTPGCTMGQMWNSALDEFYTHYNLSKYDRDYEGDNGDTSIFHHPERFHLFGDPSLKVGGASALPSDTTPPVTSHNVSREWYLNRFTLELNATDRGSGVRDTAFRIEGSPVWHEYCSWEFTVPYGTAETYTVYYQAEDFLQNTETLKSVSFGLDYKSPATPSLTLNGDPPVMEGTDFGGPVTVTLNCTDEDSGMQYIEYVLYEWNDRYETYSVAQRDYMIPPFPCVFNINRPGKYRMLAWGRDNAGNDSASAVENFDALWVDEPDPFRDLAHIMHGPGILALPPELELPFEPEEVNFYIRRFGGDWVLLGTDNNPQDGWSYLWNTSQYQDGFFDMRAVAFDLKSGASSPKAVEKEILMGTVAVVNREPASYSFTLDENPRIADRGQPVEHKIIFSHNDKDPLNKLDIFFDLEKNNQYNKEKLEILDNGTLDEKGFIHWKKESLNPGEDWIVRFKAGSAKEIPSGFEITSYAYLRCDEIPLITSDDPVTKDDPGDPTFFTVQAKGGKVSGRVLDAYLRQPLEGTTVTLQGVGYKIADENGFYLFQNLTAGKYELSASNLPVFGENKTTAEVDGTSISINLLLPRNDLIPPTVKLDAPFADYVNIYQSTLNGTAEDNPLGSGVAHVSAALRRLSDGTYWDGFGWETYQTWFEAAGTETWSVALNVQYDPGETYILLLWGTDKKANFRIEELYSQPPVPQGMAIKTAKTKGTVTLSFSWDAVPGCDYLLEVTSRPFGGYAYIYEYLSDTQYEITTFFNPGVYYWRVYARNGNNYSQASETQALLIPGSGEESGAFLY